MIHHVGLSLIITTEEEYHLAVDKSGKELCTGGPWFNDKVFQNLHGPLFEKLFVTVRQDRYYFMYGLHAYNKHKETSTDAKYFHGGRHIPKY